MPSVDPDIGRSLPLQWDRTLNIDLERPYAVTLHSSKTKTQYLNKTVLLRTCKSKVKLSPLHAMEALGGERRYSSYSFLTSALDGGEWSASRPGRALPPGKGLPVPIGQETGWAPEPVSTQRLEEKSSASVRDRSPIVQSIIRHCTTSATAAPVRNMHHLITFQEFTLNNASADLFSHEKFGQPTSCYIHGRELECKCVL
jgi:hypothetical protein